MSTQHGDVRRTRVVVIGSGFGGLFAARALRRADVDVTLIARTGHHLFQPLLYQVATGILSEGESAAPTRQILRRQKNARVVLGEVTDIDLDARMVISTVLGRTNVHVYDELIVAAGAGPSYVGIDRFADFAPGLKSIDDALELRGRIFGAFELAELTGDQAELNRLLTFVVVGAGPTGVEMAGQIAELARRTLRRDFRSIDPATARVVLVEAGPAVLPSFGEKLGGLARQRLGEVGVEVQLGATVTDMDADGVDIEYTDGHVQRIPAATKVWAAGVQASPLGGVLAEQFGAEVDGAGRVAVLPDLTLPGHPEVHVVGDLAALDDLPGEAQVAIQGGRYAATAIKRRIAGKAPRGFFRYVDKGSMATISRFSAVVRLGRLHFDGLIAWTMWLAVHPPFHRGLRQPGDDRAALAAQLHRPWSRAVGGHPATGVRPTGAGASRSAVRAFHVRRAHRGHAASRRGQSRFPGSAGLRAPSAASCRTPGRSRAPGSSADAVQPAAGGPPHDVSDR